MRISVDVGGTFTDVIVLDEETSRLRLEKVETTPRNPASGVLAGFRKAGGRSRGHRLLRTRDHPGRQCAADPHGSPRGHSHHQGVPRCVRAGQDRPAPHVRPEVPEAQAPGPPGTWSSRSRSGWTSWARRLTPFNRRQAASVASRIRDQGVEAVAVCFLHSYANSDHEQAMAEVLARECPEAAVTLSHTLSREYREYERHQHHGDGRLHQARDEGLSGGAGAAPAQRRVRGALPAHPLGRRRDDRGLRQGEPGPVGAVGPRRRGDRGGLSERAHRTSQPHHPGRGRDEPGRVGHSRRAAQGRKRDVLRGSRDLRPDHRNGHHRGGRREA